MAAAVNSRDRGHCERLARYARAFGWRLGLPSTDLDTLEYGGVLHDIGKIAIPDAVLLKKGRLTPDERALMQLHTVIGDRLLRPIVSLQRVRPIVRYHHERLDGTGYPDGLRGNDIPLLAQMVSIVDVFDALTTERPYKSAYSFVRAFDELRWEAQSGWRRHDLVEEFIAAIQLSKP
jgi:putative two-component system response regulator